MMTDQDTELVPKKFVEAVRMRIRSFEPGTLIGSELFLADWLREIDGNFWKPWTVAGEVECMEDDGWQPIETAPKETEILVWDGKFINKAIAFPGYRTNNFWFWYAVINDEEAGYGDSGYDRYGVSPLLDESPGETNLTHWRHLPNPPKSNK